jgi:DNA topoisomerase-3
MKSIVLAEKPSVGADLARVLQCTNKQKGFFEGSKYIVTWAMGHLVTLKEPGDYDNKYQEWHLEDLPMLPDQLGLKLMKRTGFQFNTISQLLKRNDVQEIIIATDAGREGELVARWILKIAHCSKPCKRLWISSQTERAIKEGFANLKPGTAYENLFQAAVCRAEADWLVGLNITRALTCKYEAQLSAGRVQTPTLAMMINREQEIKSFVPKDYWLLKASFGDYQGLWQDTKGNSRLFDLDKALALATKVQGQAGTIEDVRIQAKTQKPPQAYDLTELQRDANRQYSFPAQKTLNVLQGLYERHKIVTYPRTDSRYITTDIVETLKERLQNIAKEPYAKYVKPLLQKELNPGSHFVNNAKVSDHHALIPTEEPLNLTRLNGEEKAIFDLIAKRFIAVLYPDYKYEEITLTTLVQGERFITKGIRVIEKGWREVTGQVNTQDEDEEKEEQGVWGEQHITQQQKGAAKQVKDVKTDKKQTAPPPRYTEATLLSAMEHPGKFIKEEALKRSIQQGGLGTPATRAEIIEKLISTDYVERQGKSLVPTPKGFQLIDLVPESLKSPELTARWEQRLSLIATGQDSRTDFMQGIRASTIELVDAVKQNTRQYKPHNLTETKCLMCGSNMLSVKDKGNKSLKCSNPRCSYVQAENKDDAAWHRRSKKEVFMNRKLIGQYSDHTKETSTFADLIREAQERKKKE